MNTPRCARPFATLCAALLLALPAWAQNPRLQIQALEKLAGTASEVVDVTLEGPTLKMASRFLGNDPEVRDLVQNLTGIYVKCYQFDQPGAYSPGDLAAIRNQLQAPSWGRLVHVQSKKDGQVDVYVMVEPATGRNLGMAIVCAEEKQLVVVNIVGPIDLDKLGGLQGKLGIPKLSLGKTGAAHGQN